MEQDNVESRLVKDETEGSLLNYMKNKHQEALGQGKLRNPHSWCRWTSCCVYHIGQLTDRTSSICVSSQPLCQYTTSVTVCPSLPALDYSSVPSSFTSARFLELKKSMATQQSHLFLLTQERCGKRGFAKEMAQVKLTLTFGAPSNVHTAIIGGVCSEESGFCLEHRRL